MRAKILEREEYGTGIYASLKVHLGFALRTAMPYSEFYGRFLAKHIQDEGDPRVSACFRAVDFTDKGAVEWNDVLIMVIWLQCMFPEDFKRWDVSELRSAMYLEYLIPVAKTYLSRGVDERAAHDGEWELPWAAPKRTYWSRSFAARDRDKAQRRSAGYASLLGRLHQLSKQMSEK